MKQLFKISSLLCLLSVSGLTLANGSTAEAVTDMQTSVEIKTAEIEDVVKPFTQAEIQGAMQQIQLGLNERIEQWGKSLTRSDFERTLRGRILIKSKRQEVCGIFQSVVNETYAVAIANKASLSPASRELLKDRNAFIQALGYKNNIVDTKMGFNCRLK